MAMSAANAPDDNKDAAPAAIRILTLRIGFVLLSGEADEASHQKLTAGRCHQILKRHLTLIFKVDNLRRFFSSRADDGEGAAIANNVLTLVARAERSETRDHRARIRQVPDFASLHPGYRSITARVSASSAKTPRAGPAPGGRRRPDRRKRSPSGRRRGRAPRRRGRRCRRRPRRTPRKSCRNDAASAPVRTR